MKIHTEQDYFGVWHAVTENYDGAPDSGYQPERTGNTEQEAIDDLKRILTEEK
jgi:hypothetical protein